MKKKLLFVMVAATMTCALMACGNNKLETTTTTEVVEQGITEENITTEVTDGESTEEVGNTDGSDAATSANGAASILNDVWATYGEEEKFFVMGGDMNNPVDNAAGAYSLEDTEGLTFSLYIPADSIALIDEAASLIHGMNANTFTGAAFHLVDTANAETLATSLKDNILNTQWMCGFPDTLVIFQVNEEYVVSVFGNAEIIDSFKNKVTAVYGDNAVILVEEAITQ